MVCPYIFGFIPGKGVGGGGGGGYNNSYTFTLPLFILLTQKISIQYNNHTKNKHTIQQYNNLSKSTSARSKYERALNLQL